MLGGGIIDPLLVFFYSHFSCVRVRDLKFHDFLNTVKTNLVKINCSKKIIFAATGLGQKMVKKRPLSFLEPLIRTNIFFNFFKKFSFKLQEYCVNTLKIFKTNLEMSTGSGIPTTRILASGCTINFKLLRLLHFLFNQ